MRAFDVRRGNVFSLFVCFFSKAALIGKISSGLSFKANAQENSKTLAQNYELGKEHDLTKVMVSQNISSLAFQMTLNVRNEMLNAYKDIMNMPV